jgi:hypothetical protein
LGAAIVRSGNLRDKTTDGPKLEPVLQKISAIWSRLTAATRQANLQPVAGLLAEAVHAYVEKEEHIRALATFSQLVAIFDESSGYKGAETSTQDDLTEWLATAIATLVQSTEPAPELHGQMMENVKTIQNERALEILSRALKGG